MNDLRIIVLYPPSEGIMGGGWRNKTCKSHGVVTYDLDTEKVDSEPIFKMKRKAKKLGFLLLGGAIVLWIAFPIVPVMMMSMWRIHGVEAKMQKEEVYKPFAEILALYCQSDRSLFPDYLNYAWLPKEMDQLSSSGRAFVRDNDASVQFGGGFYHFGYHLTREENDSAPEANKWVLHQQREHSDVKTLMVFTLPKTKTMTSGQVLETVINGYDRRIKANLEYDKSYQGKIQTYLRFDKLEPARKSCREYLQKMPKDWLAILINSLLDVEEKSFDAGESFITKQTELKPDFFSYLDLAYFYQLNQRPKQSADSCLKAIGYDANVSWGNGCNADCRGYTAAMYLFQTEQYRAASALCEKLLTVTINGDFAKDGFRKIISASKAAEEGKIEPLVWDDGILPFDAFEDIDIAKLLGHPVVRPTKEIH